MAGSSCAFGVFDGLHRGHSYLLDHAQREAREKGCRFVVLTFDTDPDERFHAERLKKLMSNRMRIEALASRADSVMVLPFTEGFSALSPKEFLDATFSEGVPHAIHVGADLRFGARAAGNVVDMTRWGTPRGMAVRAHELFMEEGQPITATRIRKLLEAGKIEQANQLLGHPYVLEGTVVRGRGEGADMGFRTANIVVPELLRVLGDGVYAAYALVDGVRYKAAVNMGVAATFAETATATVEAHLLGFDADLYGKTIRIEFTNWLRPMMKFDSVEELVSTVMGNIEWVRQNL